MAENDNPNRVFYKYRVLTDLERFLDIVLKKRLYGALYDELNDPMEGKFNYSGLKSYHFKEIRSQLSRVRICSLMMKKDDQESPNDPLMWSHYADSHQGCCLEVELTRKNNKQWLLMPVHYSENLPVINNCDRDNILKIVSTKDTIWEKENEFRAVRFYQEEKQDNSPYYAVKLNAVYFGTNVSADRCRSFKRVINSIDKKIKVFRMREEKQINGLYPNLYAEEVR